MSRLALIGGHSILGEEPASGFEDGMRRNRERLMPAVEAVCGELEAIGATG